MQQLLIYTLLLLTAFSARAEGIQFFEGSWEEALIEAKRQEKLIFVDAYAVWCAPCKRMAKDVFTQDKVGEFYNRHFINVKIDCEQGEGLEFRSKYNVSAYPTLFFIDYTGEVIHSVRGAQAVDGFIRLGEVALGMVDRSGSYAEAYEAGDRSPELVYNYVKALNQAGKPSLKIANDYLRDQDDLTSPENLRFILEAVTEADSRIFEMLIEYRGQIEALEGAPAVQERIEQACENTLQKAIEYRSEELLEECKDKMKAHYPEQAVAFGLEAEMNFFLAQKDPQKFIKASSAYAKKVVSKDAEELHGLAKIIEVYFREDAKCMKQAEKLAKMAVDENPESYSYRYTYARLLWANGDKAAALEEAGRSLKMAELIGPGAKRMVEELIQRIES